MKKVTKLVAALICSVSVMALAGCGSKQAPAPATQTPAQTTPAAKETYTIGVSIPLSGTSAVRGKYIKDGTEFAVKQINEAGGINGVQLALKFEDSQGDPTKVVSTVEKLVEKEGVKALVVADSTGALAVSPKVEAAKVPMFVTAFSPSLTEKGLKYLFRSTVSDGITGAQVMDLAVKEFGYSKIAIIGSDADYGQGAAVPAAEQLKKLGKPAVAIEKFKEADKDFSSQLLNIKKANPDVLFIHSLDASAALVTKQAREMGLTFPILGATGLASEQYRDLAGAQNVEGVRVVVAFINSNPDPMVQKAVTDFKAFANYLADHNVARADASIRLIAEGIKKAGSTDSAKVAAAIHQLQSIKTPGGTFTFDEKGEGLRNNSLGQWKNGKLEFLKNL